MLRRIPVNLFCARVAALKSLLIQGKFVWMPYLIADMMMSTVYTIELLGLWPQLMNLFSCVFIIYFFSQFNILATYKQDGVSKKNVGHTNVTLYCKKKGVYYLLSDIILPKNGQNISLLYLTECKKRLHDKNCTNL